jgi:hypothetical protein
MSGRVMSQWDIDDVAFAAAAKEREEIANIADRCAKHARKAAGCFERLKDERMRMLMVGTEAACRSLARAIRERK